MTYPKFIILWHPPSSRFCICEQGKTQGNVPVYKMIPGACYEYEADAQRDVVEKEKRASK